ncbi:Probable Co/Zn/Cd efflux system membrane fusion protein [hydrothermal vent metagenome]|uniref:Probable Co/Zn/Cd efflux system membrane fusion protein n=1 Tax=hydrothermal vent metagenome TaxID=652676 RepID=A0A3B0ZY16_9ZZZZ
MNFRLIILTTFSLFLVACGGGNNNESGKSASAQESAVEHGVKHQDSKYVCPMHSQIIRDKEGSCPICGMTLVEKKQKAKGSGEKVISYYRHPHKPTITSKVPKKDEMGMDYIAIYAEESDDSSNVVISPRIVQNMGVRTEKATKSPLWRRIQTVGYIGFDETKLRHVHLRTNAWIEKLYVKSAGERVKKGDVLFEAYSPTLVNAQEEFLNAYRSTSKNLRKASEDRLRALGINSITINEIKKSGTVQQNIKIYADQNGIVSNLNIREGAHVKPSTEILSLADLSSVWLLAEVFERQTDWVKVGQSAEIYLSYLPGNVWEGRVEYVYPSLNQKTRTLKVRIRLENPGEQLKPNMFAAVLIYGGAKNNVVSIPREALIRVGGEQRVIVQVKPGEFSAKNVVSGIESGDFIEIKSGIDEGDIVVTSAQFLIDSEASLKASLNRMSDFETTESDNKKKITGSGVIKSLKPAENKINLAHNPIEALGWPAMVMDFAITQDVSLDDFQVEDKIEFTLIEGSDGYSINSITKISTTQNSK